MSMGGAFQLLGTGLDIAGSIMEYQSTKSTASLNKALISAENTIQDASTDFEIARMRREQERIISSQQAAYSKSGVTFSGSAIHVLQNTMEEVELDIFAYEFEKMVNDLQSEVQRRQQEIAVQKAKAGMYMDISKSLFGAAQTIGGMSAPSSAGGSSKGTSTSSFSSTFKQSGGGSSFGSSISSYGGSYG